MCLFASDIFRVLGSFLAPQSAEDPLRYRFLLNLKISSGPLPIMIETGEGEAIRVDLKTASGLNLEAPGGAPCQIELLHSINPTLLYAIGHQLQKS